jgi:indolepyruvate ferredoxin oxidoreductase
MHLIEQECGRMDSSRYESALELARLPQEVRGFGHVKQQAMEEYRRKLQQWQHTPRAVTSERAARTA